MALFHCSLSKSNTFTVTYKTPSPPITFPSKSQHNSLEIPFRPTIASLAKISIELHTNPNYPAFQMPDEVNMWFSECFGYKVMLAYLGDSHGVKLEDEKAVDWVSALQRKIKVPTETINFSDGAAILVVSEASLDDLHPRLGGEKAVIEKFRPNIVVDGTKAWDEDFWAELTNNSLGVRILLTSNCARCTAINVDLEKGRMGEGESGKLLKKMMHDRRIDVGNKWSPIFGRYGFPTQHAEIRVGDDLVVSVRNQEHTVWSKCQIFEGLNISNIVRWCHAPPCNIQRDRISAKLENHLKVYLVCLYPPIWNSSWALAAGGSKIYHSSPHTRLQNNKAMRSNLPASCQRTQHLFCTLKAILWKLLFLSLSDYDVS